jgi:hypothetical protein
MATLFPSTSSASRIIALLIASALIFTACDSNEPDENAGEQEVISNVTLTFTSNSSPDVTAEAVFNSGSELQSTETITLENGINYTVFIELENRFADTAAERDITAEIAEEDDEHRFFYRVEDDSTGGSPLNGILNITGLDTDGNGDPLGLSFNAETQSATQGDTFLRVKLRHYEDEAVLPQDKQNDTIDAPEEPEVVENDVDFTFPLVVN